MSAPERPAMPEVIGIAHVCFSLAFASTATRGPEARMGNDAPRLGVTHFRQERRERMQRWDTTG